ncbi:MAG: DUF1318 domain-containing protein [Deltaproteobacteria bacterium]|nr:DUF1318 domain-containing protein [Deltaproteobacteria bacterium]
MRGLRKTLWVGFGCSLVFLFACVTINIYFPAEEVRSVAGEIVHDIRGKGVGEEKAPQQDDKSSRLLQNLLAFAAPKAWAGEVTAVSNPTIRALKEKMKKRFNRMKPYYAKGMLKEGDDGYVSLGSLEGLGLKEKRDLKSLVNAENQDRKALYSEVAKAMNIDPGQIGKVAEIFAKEWKKSLK